MDILLICHRCSAKASPQMRHMQTPSVDRRIQRPNITYHCRNTDTQRSCLQSHRHVSTHTHTRTPACVCNETIFTCTHVCNPCPCACPRAGTRKQMHTHLNLNTFKNYTCMHVCLWNALFLPQVVTLGCNWCPRPLGQHCLVGRSLGAMCTHKGCQCKRL